MSSKAWLRIIGDVHGYYGHYLELLEDCEYSLQLGDMGFDYDFLKRVDGERHKVIAGNHDNYDRWGTSKFIHMQSNHWLGDYGTYSVADFGEIFFVRGGRSIDWKYRKKGVNFFEEEELTYGEGLQALEMYQEVKPNIVVSHECPASINELVSGVKTWDGEIIQASRTSWLLESMLRAHRPLLWVFGHHHRDWSEIVLGTKFICLDELCCLDFQVRENILTFSLTS